MVNSIPRPPTPVNEPILGYLPGSPERISLKEELTRQSGEVIEIPCIINGVEVYTNNVIGTFGRIYWNYTFASKKYAFSY